MKRALVLLAIVFSSLLAACQGCRGPKPGTGEPELDGKPTLRLYLLSTVAGALEPCGCSKDQLGGLDHLAAFIKAEQEKAPNTLLLSAGPLLFLDSKLKETHATQDSWKAESIALAMKDMSLAAWAPGFNDWAGGAEALEKRVSQSGAALMTSGRKLIDVSGVKVGIIGVSDPKDRAGKYPDGVTPHGASQVVSVVKKELAALTKEGAQISVVLAAMQRGAALRIADAIPELNVLVVGKPSSEGDGNTSQPPPELIGTTLVVETANHVQTVSVVDVFLKGDGNKPVVLADAGGVKKAEKIGDVMRRIRELEGRINSWEKGGKVDAKDLAARKADLEQLRKERTALEAETPAPKGSFFRYRVQEVRDGLGEDDTVTARMKAFYKRVNTYNKTAFADLKPLPPAAGQAEYVGVDVCTNCHLEAREVWDKTPHAKAYKTLETDFKEFNLECVNCHVTGYGKAGGSTVTHVKDLKDVQCETCHGPGSLHVADTDNDKLIVLEPDPKTCVEQCHHPPHVEGFDPVQKMGLILGPGHGD